LGEIVGTFSLAPEVKVKTPFKIVFSLAIDPCLDTVLEFIDLDSFTKEYLISLKNATDEKENLAI